MAISGTTTDYSTRTKDVHIFNGVNPFTADATPIVLKFGAISAVCTGVQKLVQRYAILFLTAVGSQTYFTDFGSSFMNAAKIGYRNMDKTEIQHMFNFANAKIITEMREYQAANSTIPLDEQINTALLNDCGVNGDSLFVDIKIETLAGETVTFVVPLPITK